MLDYYFQSIRDWAESSPGTVWKTNESIPRKLNCFRVAKSLLKLIDCPDSINQSGFNFCGEAPFLRAWAYRDPDAVIAFAKTLYEQGAAQMRPADSTESGYSVTPEDTLLNSDWMVNHPDNSLTAREDSISEAVWMICGALTDTENDIMPDFDGYPEGTGDDGTINSELESWLEATKLYGSIEEVTWPALNGVDVTDVQKHPPDEFTDVFLNINANMLRNAESVTPSDALTPDFLRPPYHGGVNGLVSNHYVMLNKPIEVRNDRIFMNIWTWGGNYDMVISIDHFNDDYYGLIAARSWKKRMATSLQPLQPKCWDGDSARIWFSQSNTLECEWKSYNPDIEWFGLCPVIRSMNCSKSRLRTVWQRECHYHISIPRTEAEAFAQAIAAAHDPPVTPPFATGYEIYGGNSFGIDYGWCVTVAPAIETETTHFRFCYNSDGDQSIKGGLQSQNFELSFASGKTVGRGFAGGGMEINLGSVVSITTDINTPAYIQKLAIWFEYFYYMLISPPVRLKDPSAWQKVQVSIRAGMSQVVWNGGGVCINIAGDLDDSAMPTLCFELLIDAIQLSYFKGTSPIKAADLWDTIPRQILKDFVFSEDNFRQSVASFMCSPQLDALSQHGKAALWLYACSQFSRSQPSGCDAIGVGLVAKCWDYTAAAGASGYHLEDWCSAVAPTQTCLFAWEYSAPQRKDVYNDNTFFGNFVLAIGSRLLSAPVNDKRFCFADNQPPLPLPVVVSHTLGSGQSLHISGNLSQSCSMCFHRVILGTEVQFLHLKRFIVGSSKVGLLQVMLLDAGDRVIDVLKTDSAMFERGIGLRNGIVTQLLICEARTNDIGGSYQFDIEMSGLSSGCDLMITRWNRTAGQELVLDPAWYMWDYDTPDVWLISPGDGQSDLINVKPGAKNSVVNVRIHNHGNTDATNVKVYFYAQSGDTDAPDSGWEAMDLRDPLTGVALGQSWLKTDVPANGAVQISAQWSCPYRGAVRQGCRSTVAFAVELQCSDDGSSDNNRAVKCHAWTNVKSWDWNLSRERLKKQSFHKRLPRSQEHHHAAHETRPRRRKDGKAVLKKLAIRANGIDLSHAGQQLARSVIVQELREESRKTVFAKTLPLRVTVDPNRLTSIVRGAKQRNNHSRQKPTNKQASQGCSVTFCELRDGIEVSGFTVVIPDKAEALSPPAKSRLPRRSLTKIRASDGDDQRYNAKRKSKRAKLRKHKDNAGTKIRD